MTSAKARARSNRRFSLKKLTQFATAFGSIAVALGSVWLAFYFVRVVHVVPDADFGRLALAVGIIGVLGTLEIATIGFLFAIPALVFEWQAAVEAHPNDDASLREIVATALRGAHGERPWWFFIALGMLGLAYEVALTQPVLARVQHEFALTDQAARFIVFSRLVAASAGTGFLFALRDMVRRRLDRPRWLRFLGSGVLWGLTFPFGLVLLHNSPSLDDQTSIAALIGIPALAVYLNVMLGLPGFIRTVGPPLMLCILILYGKVDSILGNPVHELNLGFGFLSLTANTHHAAQTALDCGVPVRHRHFTPFVLSNLGDSYVIRCDCTKRAMEIPKSEATQRTIAFPDAAVTPAPSPSPIVCPAPESRAVPAKRP